MEQATRERSSGTLSAALAEGAELLRTNPRFAEALARDILKAIPGQQQALTLLVSAERAQGNTHGARMALEAMAREQPRLAAVQCELGLLLGELGETEAAIAALSRVVELEPNHPAAWRALAEELVEAGRSAEAAAAYKRQFASSVNDLKLLEDAPGFGDDQLGMAEAMLNAFLEMHPTDVYAIHMLGHVYVRLGRLNDTDRLWSLGVQLAPDFVAMRLDHARLLLQTRQLEEANRQLDILLVQDPHNPEHRELKAVALMQIGEYRQSIKEYETLLGAHPDRAKSWTAYGDALRTVGRYHESIAAYHRSIALKPDFGEAYWSLANLKIYRFSPAEIEAMRAQLGRSDLAEANRYHLHFALGKALEDEETYPESFEQYRQGNALRRARIDYSADEMSEHVRRAKLLFSADFLRARAGSGCLSEDPIFIFGPPRSGSTLVEQILASHSRIEGTMELTDLISIVLRLCPEASDYVGAMRALDADALKSLGEEYLRRTRIQRKLGRAFFTDKMPNNFHHLGFIHLILPNAKIIDVRRHPLACGFSNFRQHYASNIGLAYDLTDIGRYYRDYVEVMAHFDAVLPGRVHRMFYEELIRHPQREIRRLLEYCSVPFEDACLNFHRTERGVFTASSEQVRRPVYSDALEQWRHFEPWLGPLKAALGPVLDAYPAVPAF